MKMNTQLSENTDIRTIQTIIDEAHAMGLRVVHKPDSNVIDLLERQEARRVMLANTSVECA
jgi:hypothetical protein